MMLVVAILLCFPGFSQASEPDWTSEVTLPKGTTRENIYNYSDTQLKQIRKEGYLVALKWPVTVTGVLLPYGPIKYFMEVPKKFNPLRKLIESIAKVSLGYSDMDGMYGWLGLSSYPHNDAESKVFQIPYPTDNDSYPDFRMGASIIQSQKFPHSRGLTYSCATCHSGTFMGKSIMGLTNKRPRANEFFVMAKKYVPFVPAGFFKYATKATAEEKAMFVRTKNNLKFVDPVAPQVLGLDTSLPHVALSLHNRQDDAYATMKPLSRSERRRRGHHKLETFVADSKPMPWWNLKYKTRWLSDGSVVSGNPISTNFLWNEIGRGTDLHELEAWMKNNKETIKKLTAAAFSTRAPRWTDFFDEDTIDLAAAKRGEVVFNHSCRKCHGQYEKGWSDPGTDGLSTTELIKTTKVTYHKKTPVKDVGTDPQRWQATSSFSDGLNKLAISKWMKTTVEPQVGYVPPPLEGIFLRYPYFHNNSIPSLCALMQKPEDRPKKFIQGPSVKVEDFDSECVGYPVGDAIPSEWLKEKDAIYDTSRPGLRNIGHTKVFWDSQGNPRQSEQEKKDLLMYLKTL